MFGSGFKTALRLSAQRILTQNIDPPLRVRLLRDVLQTSEEDADLVEAATALDRSRWVRLLMDEQYTDGSWGRFHSQDSASARRIPTTEYAVDRALTLGLNSRHPILQRAAAHCVDILKGDVAFPDPPEKNDRWPTGVQLFTASTLAKIQPHHPMVRSVRSKWAEIAQRTFASGDHSLEAERAAHLEFHHITTDLRYLTLRNKYTLALLGSDLTQLEAQTQCALLKWICHHPGGIRYLGIPVNHDPPTRTGSFEGWLLSLELLALFQPEQEHTLKARRWLWSQRGSSGLWDFRARSPTSFALPLSDSWQNATNRCLDWSVRVLTLLNTGASDVHIRDSPS